MRVEGIESEDELKKAQAAAQAKGTSVTNYEEWDEILSKFEEYGIDSTGSYEGDKAKIEEIQRSMQERIDETQKNIQNNPENKEDTKVQKVTETDKEQELKATVANATSSQIMADYMKYYHLLM